MAPVVFLLLILLVPLAEIATFIEVGGWIGTMPTVALVIGLAIGGLWLLRHQGLGTLRKAQASMDRGEMPVEEVTDGAFIVLAAFLMVLPGLLTDALGLLLLVPVIRRPLSRAVMRWVRANMRVSGMSTSYRSYSGPIIEGEAEAVETKPDDEPAGKNSGPSPWIGGGGSN